jgi:PAS domain S-box-containing protein
MNLHEIGDVLEVGVLQVDTDLVIRGWNRWLETASGLSASDVVGRLLVQTFPGIRDSPAEQAFRHALAGGTTVFAHRFHRYLLLFPPPAGVEGFDCMQQSARVVPVADENGRVSGAMALIQDVTERVAREEDLRDALLRAETANRAKSEFLAAMSHELRTPIGAVSGYADLLAEGILGPVSSTQRDHLTRIKSVSTHLLRIVEEILTFARVEAGREEVHLSASEAGAIAREAANAVEPLTMKKGLRLELCLSDAPIPMVTDEVKVRQVLINLLGNAVKFTDRGTVSLSVSATGPQTVVFTVQDTGLGIAMADLERIFEPFTQADSSLARAHEGTGLGLPVSRQLARLIGGDVTVSSQPGAGSTFTLLLPTDSAHAVSFRDDGPASEAPSARS